MWFLAQKRQFYRLKQELLPSQNKSIYCSILQHVKLVEASKFIVCCCKTQQRNMVLEYTSLEATNLSYRYKTKHPIHQKTVPPQREPFFYAFKREASLFCRGARLVGCGTSFASAHPITSAMPQNKFWVAALGSGVL